MLVASACAGEGPVHRPLDDEPRPPEATWAEPVAVGRVRDRRIREASGLVASATDASLLWTLNDSGNAPVLFCIDLAGRTRATVRLQGATNRDWETLARGPGADGRIYLYVGDIGDNLAELTEIVVYRVPEPDLPAAGKGRLQRRADALRFRYPDGPHDAEALALHPASGDLYILTKVEGRATVYRATAPLEGSSVFELERVGRIDLPGAEAATGADISPDGRALAVSTYGHVYEFPLRVEDDRISFGPAIQVPTGFRPQGETVAYALDGDAVITTSERPGSFIWLTERN
jgi:hypothetical protein